MAYPETASWYQKSMGLRGDEIVKRGLGIDQEELYELKALMNDFRVAQGITGPEHNYRGVEGRQRKDRHGGLAYAMLPPKFRRAPEAWTKDCLCGLIQRSKSDVKRRDAARQQAAELTKLQQGEHEGSSHLSGPSHSIPFRAAPSRVSTVPKGLSIPWSDQVQIHIGVEATDDTTTTTTTTLAMLDPFTVSEEDSGTGLADLSWSKISATLRTLHERQLLVFDDCVYLSPRQDQAMPLYDENTLRSAFRTMWRQGTTTILLTTVPAKAPWTPPTLGTSAIGPENTTRAVSIAPTVSSISRKRCATPLPTTAQFPNKKLASQANKDSAILHDIPTASSKVLSTTSLTPTPTQHRPSKPFVDEHSVTTPPQPAQGKDFIDGNPLDATQPTEGDSDTLQRLETLKGLEPQEFAWCAQALVTRWRQDNDGRPMDLDRDGLTVGRFTLYMRDVLRLAPSSRDLCDNWLNDNIIDILLENEPLPDKVVALSAMLLSSSTTTAGLNALLSRVTPAATTEHRAVLACNVDGLHWVAVELTANPLGAHVSIFDSLDSSPKPTSPRAAGKNPRLSVVALQFAKTLTASSPEPHPVAVSAMVCLPQENGSDCGCLTLYHLVARMHDRPATWADSQRLPHGNRGLCIRRYCAQRLISIMQSNSSAPCLAELFGLVEDLPSTETQATAAPPFRPSSPQQLLDGVLPVQVSTWNAINVGTHSPTTALKNDRPPPPVNPLELPSGALALPDPNRVSPLPRTPLQLSKRVDGLVPRPASSPVQALSEPISTSFSPHEGSSAMLDTPTLSPAARKSASNRTDDDDDDDDIINEDDFAPSPGSDIYDPMDEAPQSDEENSGSMGRSKVDNIVWHKNHTLKSRLARVTPKALTMICRLFPWLEKIKFENGASFNTSKRFGTAPDFAFKCFQLAFIALAFLQERTLVGGGLLADVPGLGKTVQAIGLYLLNLLHDRNVREVLDEWRADPPGDRKHLPKHAAAYLKCPNRDANALACWCELSNRTHLFIDPPATGVTLIITPPAGIDAFADDARRMLQGGWLQTSSTPPRIAVHVDGYSRHDFCPTLLPKEVNECCRVPNWTAAVTKEAKKAQELLPSGSWTIKVSGAQATSSSASQTRAGRSAAQVLIVTTPGCIDSRVVTVFKAFRDSVWTRNKPVLHHEQCLLMVRRAIMDECHHEVRATRLNGFWGRCRDEFSKAYDYQRHTAIWGMSGTPEAPTLLSQLHFTYTTLRRSGWVAVSSSMPDLKPLETLTLPQLKEMGGRLDRLRRKAGKNVNADLDPRDSDTLALTNYLQKILPVIQIRRDYDTPWYNGKLVAPPTYKHHIEFVTCKPGEEERAAIKGIETQVRSEALRVFSEHMATWKDAGSPKHQQPKHPKENQAASYPTAMAMVNVAPLVLHWRKLRGADNDGEDKASFVRSDKLLEQWSADPTGKEFTAVVEDSNVGECAKYVQTKKLLEYIRHRKRKNGEPCKALVFIHNVGTLATFRNLLERAYPGAVVAYVAGMTGPQKKAAHETFKTTPEKWILIATRESAKESINLQCANYNIIVEPAYQLSTLKQTWSRSARTGQSEDHVYTYILQNEASGIELRMRTALHLAQSMEATLAETTLEGTKMHPILVEDV
jgi:hypothetical protein